MKRKFLIIILLCCTLLTGCFNKKQDIFKEIKNKYGNLKEYILTGDLEIINNDEIYNYDVKVIYQKKDKFYVSLKNRSNNHEQIILKNDEAVYVLTPTLNKSFKFQSSWPYNNSQVYLIQSIINDIEKDKERNITSSNEQNIITSDVNYPNNKKLVKQIVTFDKDNNLKIVSIVDENDTSFMKMIFKTIELNPTIDSNTFDINKIMDNVNVSPSEQTSSLDDVIYPLYIPLGTVLTSSEKIDKDDGERIIMTFEGEKPFLLVEETSSIEKEFSIIPTYGEPYLLTDTVGALTDTSITWSSNGIDYYIVSDVMSRQELIDIARSVSAIPVMK